MTTVKMKPATKDRLALTRIGSFRRAGREASAGAKNQASQSFNMVLSGLKAVFRICIEYPEEEVKAKYQQISQPHFWTQVGTSFGLGIWLVVVGNVNLHFQNSLAQTIRRQTLCKDSCLPTTKIHQQTADWQQ
jgi:hypothetical protein